MAGSPTAALRLRLPCPHCDELLCMQAFAVEGQVALSCTLCGHGWVEADSLDAGLALRVVRFCGEADEVASRPLVPTAAGAPELPATALPGSGKD